ncbi:hypothetical protein [Nocardia flavorosea]|uniref:Uncharacterized protein n=1 Tax=Nocardia flavorosea TaxID=53429 RepID=A0A846YRW9_9NOCA|nr:hypothetical protein [Nocardia flavorosea]NKY60421.1 hypothetical protein [Nocardia flavorosea]
MTTYNIGDLVHADGTTWKVRKTFTSEMDGSPAVSLVDADDPNHGTAFRTSVLDKIGTRIPHPSNDRAAAANRLAHVVAAYTGKPDNEFVVTATRKAIHGFDSPGVTWGDLRALLAEVRNRA